jgi:RNA polymerase sigma factor (sigma-70 family)
VTERFGNRLPFEKNSDARAEFRPVQGGEAEGAFMPTDGLHRVLEHLRQALPPLDGGGLSDGELLARFAAARDEASFAALVRRHGRMVLGVCRRVLGDAHDADDAFQATFLVLVRKAATLADGEAVGNWLYGVAYRAAVEARCALARRRARERPMAQPPQREAAPAEVQDWRPLLDRELNRLPEKYRSAVVLCELEGRPRREAARLLGVPEGTLSSRLAAARRLLADRLTRRGVAVSAGALAALWAEAASAAVPEALAAATAKAASAFAAGQAAAAPVAALTQGVLKAMFLSKLKTAIAAAMVATALALGCFAYRGVAGPGAGAAPPAEVRDEEKGAADLEALRKENELLKLNLRLTLEKIRALEAEARQVKALAPIAPAKVVGPFEKGWDEPLDPDKDCKFVLDKDALTIEVPGKDHDLAVERPLMNSPRLMRDVEGDFVAQVRVSGAFSPSTDSTTPQRVPFVGAGLWLMADDQTYVRLDRATLRRDGEAKTYASWELRRDGKWELAGDATVQPLEDKATYLRLERKGDKLLASVSHDGKKWSELSPLELKLPAKLKLGVGAGSTSTEPFKPRFDEFKLTQSGDRKRQ